jgi:hypothetical protein
MSVEEVEALSVPPRWDDVTPGWMTRALSSVDPDLDVAAVEMSLRDDGTNRRARFGVTYRSGQGPASVFVKAESDVPGRREIHAKNGNLFNEALLYRSNVELPIEHPHAYAAVVDEPHLDYVIVMEDLLTRGAEPLHALRPMTVTQAARGLAGLARLHGRYWNAVDDHPVLRWVQPFAPTEGLLRPMRKGAALGLDRARDHIPPAVASLSGGELVDVIWARYLTTLTTGPQTLLHGDPHIGNTYLAADDIGFLDWQVVRRGHWSHDVGYFLQSALTAADRRHHEADLVEHYRTALDVPDHTRPSAQDAWLRYRATPVHGLVMWAVTLLSDVHVAERSLELAGRYAAAFAELDTPDAITTLQAIAP